MMEEEKKQEAANTQAETKQDTKRTNKSWEGFLKWKGTVTVNDPTLLV